MRLLSPLTLLLVALSLALVLVATTLSSAHLEDWFPSDWQNKEKHRAIINRNLQIIKSVRTSRPHLADVRKADPKKCDDCFKVANFVIDLIMSKTGDSILTYTLEKECKKHFSNNTKDATTCEDVVKIVNELLVKGLDEIAGSLHFNISNIICSDALKLCLFPCCNTNTPYQPEQRRLAFSTSQGVAPLVNMTVSWLTLNPTVGDNIQYYINGNQNQIITTSNAHYQGTYDFAGFVGYIHSVTFTNLPHNSSITYRVGSPKGMSSWETFKTLPINIGTSQGRPLRAAVVADIGIHKSHNTLKQISSLIDQGNKVDAFILVGDQGYADGNEPDWSTWGRYLDSVYNITTRVPLITVDGNHELLDNFTAYKKRYAQFQTPAGHGAPSDSMYYYLNLGPVNIFMLDTETEINTADLTPAQLAWAKPLLEQANAMPGHFTFVGHHRPLYCSNGKSDCVLFATLLRDQAEDLYKANGVDIIQNGHMHSYERTYQVYKNKLVNTSNFFPTAPISVINGLPGNKEPISAFDKNNDWSAVKYNADFVYQVYEWQQSIIGDGNLHTTLKAKTFRSSDNNVVDEFAITSRR